MDQGLSVAVVARRLGLAPATLRTWDRRYGVGPSDHIEGAHRRYTEADIARLMQMRRLILAGRTPAQAAAEVTFEPGPSMVFAQPGAPLPAEIAVRGLTNAALALDFDGVALLLDQELALRGPQGLWSEIVVPVMIAVGERWEKTQASIEVEHTLSEALLELFATAARRVSKPINTTPILLASADEELHSLPLYALAASLAQHHLSSRVLGARTPPAALAATIRRTGPAAVFIWSSTPATGSLDQLATLPTVRPSPCVILGGPGWQVNALPSQVQYVESLDQAIAAIHQSLGLHTLS